MARKNIIKRMFPVFTHEGGKAKVINPELQLRRSVMACMLWEKTFYEDGEEIAARIADLVPRVRPHRVAEIAVEARERMKLRHVPLLLVRLLVKRGYKEAGVVLERVIQRADELSEFLAIYWKDGRQPLSAQVKRGLAGAFRKFDEYQLAKYDRDTVVRLRDVLFMVHAKPKDKEQAAVWKRLADGELVTPDTWEVALSAGRDKKSVWERMLKERKLGALALLRNLRNMEKAGVDENLMRTGIQEMKTERVLPFRFIAAARFAPRLEPELEQAMFKCLEGHSTLGGKTVLLVDVSGSMDDPISERSDLQRIDAACGLAMLVREICERVEVWTFSDRNVEVPPRRGFALRDAIVDSQSHRGTYLGDAVKTVNKKVQYDRLIVITDEQSHDRVPDPAGRGYIINVAANRNGVGYGKWIHIDGWSEAVIDYLMEYEKMESELSEPASKER